MELTKKERSLLLKCISKEKNRIINFYFRKINDTYFEKLSKWKEK